MFGAPGEEFNKAVKELFDNVHLNDLERQMLDHYLG